MLIKNLAIYHKFKEELTALGPFEPKPLITVAVSGGIDSLALTFLLQTWCEENQGRLVAVTIDHGLRVESSQEASYVHQLLNERGIEHHCLVWEHGELQNIQASARKARYELLTNFCYQKQILHLATAHHHDDQAETIYMNLNRGSGVDGLIGIKRERIHNKIRLIRPLLHFNKQELKQFIQYLGIIWCEDPSNQKEKYTRVRTRKLLTNQPLFAKRLVATGEHCLRALKFINRDLCKFLTDHVLISPCGYGIIDIKALNELDHELLYRVFIRVLETIGGKLYKTRFTSLKNTIFALLSNQQNKLCLHNCQIERLRIKEKDLLIFYKETSKTNPSLILLKENCYLWDERFIVQIKKEIAMGVTIDYLQTNQWGIIRKKFPFVNDFVDQKLVNKRVLFTLPVIKNLENIVGIPHINYWEDAKWIDAVSIYFSPQKSLMYDI